MEITNKSYCKVHLKSVSHAIQRGRMRQKVALLCVLRLTIEAIVFEARDVPGLRYASDAKTYS